MVNPLKHMKINRNPFVKFLKKFTKEDLATFIAMKDFKGTFCTDLEDGRRIIIQKDGLYLVNKEYEDTGVFRISLDDLSHNDGTLYFRPDDNEKDLEYGMAIYYTSKNELYSLINEIDSINDGAKVKELFIKFEKVGIMLGRAYGDGNNARN